MHARYEIDKEPASFPTRFPEHVPKRCTIANEAIVVELRGLVLQPTTAVTRLTKLIHSSFRGQIFADPQKVSSIILADGAMTLL